jgi:hypothetical protein
MEKTKWFRAKGIMAVFAAVAFVIGFLLLDRGITGNVILENQYPVDFASIIGLVLILCSAVLVIYIIKKR